MKNNFFFVLLCLIVFTCSCKKDKSNADIVPCRIFQDLPAFSYFQRGTYWIYQDSATFELDSVFVVFDTNYVYHNNGWGRIKEDNYQFYTISTRSSFDGDEYLYSIDYGFYGSNGQVGTWRKRIAGSSSGHSGTTFLMANIFENNAFISPYTSPGTVFYKGLYDTLQIIGLRFPQTVKFYDSENASEENDSKTYFYISKNIGIVRKEILSNNKVWNLIRFHIEK